MKKIHSDERGDINIITEYLTKYPEVTMFYTKKGYARGGCIHFMHHEFNVVLEGQIKYVIGDETHFLYDGDSITIPKNTPHYFISLTDSLVLEWGCDESEKKKHHEEFRTIVDKINKNQK